MSKEHRSEQYQKKAIPVSMSRRVLRREQLRIMQRCMDVFPPRPAMKVLDLGINTALTSREDFFFENFYPFLDQVTAVAVEPPRAFTRLFPECPFVQTRREDEVLPFANGEFDLVFCNAVIEHVGSRERQRAFAAEVLRVGKNVFLTTPNRWYPVELHTVTPLLHWLPTAIHRPIYRKLGFDFFSREGNLNLLSANELASLIDIDDRAVRVGKHRFLGFVSNLLAIVEAPPVRAS